MMKQAVHGFLPVSYTHLDVYKRQFVDKGIRAIYYDKDDPEKTTVIVHKTDDAGKGLPGAKFALYKNKNCAASDLVLELGPTDSNGKAESASFHVMQDVYYLKETQPPTGYPSQPNKVYEAVVKSLSLIHI